ncbi:MAG: hydrogenase nickel incorporation protein HypB [Lachnospiraceae bacterium]|nr:hydrogenase nickel incorporation protein HypB [Lachnospiraceae bacterium]
MDISILETKATLIAEDSVFRDLVRTENTESGTFFVNVMASPGSGKTTFLKRTIEELKQDLRIGVIEADADGDVDARLLTGIADEVIQVHTGGSCHMDAKMTLDGLRALNRDRLDLVFLENIGNLVCPAEFDTGADVNVVILSVPEGDDKPLKYPLMFEVADIVLVNKIDVKPVFDFSDQRFESNVRLRNDHAPILYLSAKTGEGFEKWIRLIRSVMREKRSAR